MKRKRNLIEGNIKKQLFKLALPMLFGMMGIVVFNLVDTYFLGKLGVKQLAAISFCFPVIMLINSLSMGIGVATSSLISRNIIANSHEEVKKMSSRSLLLGFIIIILFVIVGLLTIRPVFSLLGAEGVILEYINDYMEIWYFGIIFIIISMIGNNIIRATGNTFFPGMLMLSSAILNGILDPILIFGFAKIPAMGIKGAAIATVITRGISMILMLFVLIKKERLLTLYPGKIKDILITWKKVFYIAAPASLGMLITPISVGMITMILSGFGKEAVASFGVVSRIEMFALMIIASLGSVLIIFLGQNLSKNKFVRIFTALKYSLRFAIVW